jgi:hypothetical protein
MSNGHLVTGFLNFDFLITNKFAALQLNDQLTSCVVRDTLATGTVNFRIKFFRDDWLINFKAARVTGIDSNLDARFDVRGTSHYTSQSDETSNLVGLDFSHLLNHFLCVGAWHNKNLILAL